MSDSDMGQVVSSFIQPQPNENIFNHKNYCHKSYRTAEIWDNEISDI